MCAFVCVRDKDGGDSSVRRQTRRQPEINQPALQLSVSEMFTIRQHNGGTDGRGGRQIRVRERAPACHLHTGTTNNRLEVDLKRVECLRAMLAENTHVLFSVHTE